MRLGLIMVIASLGLSVAFAGTADHGNRWQAMLEASRNYVIVASACDDYVGAFEYQRARALAENLLRARGASSATAVNEVQRMLQNFRFSTPEGGLSTAYCVAEIARARRIAIDAARRFRAGALRSQ